MVAFLAVSGRTSFGVRKIGRQMPGHERVVNSEHLGRQSTVHADAAFSEFRSRFEEAVPVFDSEAIAALAASGASWYAIVDAVAAVAPHDFVRFSTLDVTPLMRPAGHDRPVVQYLVGNHAIAERMFRKDPRAMLYAPLRILLLQDDAGLAEVTFDHPSTLLASLGDPDIDDVAGELDHKLHALLRSLDSPSPFSPDAHPRQRESL